VNWAIDEESSGAGSPDFESQEMRLIETAATRVATNAMPLIEVFICFPAEAASSFGNQADRIPTAGEQLAFQRGAMADRERGASKSLKKK
jgi:hypothetical protein